MGRSKKSFEIHPFTLITESIKLNLFEDLVDILHKSKNYFDEKYDKENIKNVSTFALDEEVEYYEGNFLSDEFIDLEIEDDIAKIIDLCLLDDDRKFLKYYINQASYLFPETRDFLGDFENENNNFLSELDPEILCQILETFLEKNFTPENFDPKKAKSHFMLNDLKGMTELHDKIFYLAVPFAYYLWSPFQNIDNARKIKGACISCLTKDDPITLTKLKNKLKKLGYKPKISFLYSLVINDADFITLLESDNKTILVDRADEIVPAFDHIGKQNPPGTFFKNPNNAKRIGVAFGKFIANDAVIDKKALKKILLTNDGGKFFDKLDLEEIAYKLFLHYENNSINRSDLFQEVCDKTIKLLEKEKRLMRWGEIARKLKIPNLPLDPVKLGPGRLMAYAPSKVFLERRSSAYVLKELVSSGKTHETGKIMKERVITPFKEKKWNFDQSTLIEKMEANPFISKYQIIPMDDLAQEIAYSLPDLPTEPYYLNLIKETIFDNLEHKFSKFDPRRKHMISREIYPDRGSNSWSKWRNECLSQALDCPLNFLPSAIDNLEDSHRNSFTKILG